MNLVKVKYEKKSICPCGYGVLLDTIPLGTIYTIDLDTLSSEFTYHCGGCHTQHNHVPCVKAIQLVDPLAPMAYLPRALFGNPIEQACPTCRGIGAEFPANPRTEKCEACGGTGSVKVK